MTENTPQSKDEFLNPRSKYWGKFTPQNLAFNTNLQEFTNKIGLICSLETGGKISSMEAYQQIKDLWKQLKASKKNLLKDEPAEDQGKEE
ncbi:hypothetical protein C7271_15115 [filamentous cyanobacterium CCP5]|nr:hypothetical protein C7271_15115 [filamentous cyanobacterium CCP5]